VGLERGPLSTTEELIERNYSFFKKQICRPFHLKLSPNYRDASDPLLSHLMKLCLKSFHIWTVILIFCNGLQFLPHSDASCLNFSYKLAQYDVNSQSAGQETPRLSWRPTLQ
jgi:hypothetical protein